MDKLLNANFLFELTLSLPGIKVNKHLIEEIRKLLGNTEMVPSLWRNIIFLREEVTSNQSKTYQITMKINLDVCDRTPEIFIDKPKIRKSPLLNADGSIAIQNNPKTLMGYRNETIAWCNFYENSTKKGKRS